MKEKADENIKFTKSEDIAVINKFDKYISLINEHKGKNDKAEARTTLTMKLIKELLEDKVVSNDFIELDKPFYFDYDKLLKDHEVTAEPNPPISNIENCFKIVKVPNNFDSFNKDVVSYCYGDNVSSHRGITIYTMVKAISDKKIYPVPVPLIFDYDSKKNEIKIGYATFDKLYLYAESEEHKNAIDNIIESIHYLEENIVDESGNINIALVSDENNFIIPMEFERFYYDVSKDKSLFEVYDSYIKFNINNNFRQDYYSNLGMIADRIINAEPSSTSEILEHHHKKYLESQEK